MLLQSSWKAGDAHSQKGRRHQGKSERVVNTDSAGPSVELLLSMFV